MAIAVTRTFFCGLALSGLALASLLSNSAWAGQPVLNQTPQTIERTFGRYQTRLTTSDGVTYTYSATQLRQLFPQFPKTEWSITFVNNRAKYINLNVAANPNADDFTYDQPEAAKFFQYVFGYQPPTWQELSTKFTGNTTIHDYEYCLGDGIATSFTRMGYKQFADFIQLYYDPRCEKEEGVKDEGGGMRDEKGEE